MKEEDINVLAKTGRYENDFLNGRLEETHISWIILTKKFAFKIKKPIALSFLDFSSMQKRKKYCERELLLNQRFSDIYLDVLPVRKENNRWHLGGDHGNVVDYAVQMKRLSSAKKMDVMLKRNLVQKKHIAELAKSIGSFHQKAEVINQPFNRDWMASLFNDIETILPFIHDQFGKKNSSLITRATARSNYFLKSNEKHFQKRITQGFKRDVHGDLHSGNIFLYNKPIIFDCIEFNDLYRQIDVLNEIAFFCMDLEAYGENDLSRFFLSLYHNYFPCLQTPEDNRLFNYFKCYRANVRLKVHALAAQQEGNGKVFDEHLESMAVYFTLLNDYLKAI